MLSGSLSGVVVPRGPVDDRLLVRSGAPVKQFSPAKRDSAGSEPFSNGRLFLRRLTRRASCATKTAGPPDRNDLRTSELSSLSCQSIRFDDSHQFLLHYHRENTRRTVSDLSNAGRSETWMCRRRLLLGLSCLG